MLSIAALTGGPDYYLRLASVSYYTQGGEPLPIWAGAAAQEFELSGIARPEQVEKLCAGFCPETGERLVFNAGKESRNPGHDLTFSMPKSASVIWATADEGLRQAIQAAQLKAVKQAISFLEEKAGRARIGKQGQEIVKCPLLFALFEHGTSRALDPQLHTHAVLINVTMHPDGHTTAVDSTYLYHFKMAGGAVYRAALADELQKLGFQIERREIGASILFEVAGVPEGLVDEFSKRRAEIERVMDLRKGGLDVADARYAELICKETRRAKEDDVPRAELFEGWREVGRKFGVDENFVRGLLKPHREQSPEEKLSAKAEIWKEAVSVLSEKQSHWNEPELTKHVAERSAGRLSVRDLRELIENKMRSPELCDIGRLQTERRNAKFKQYVDRSESRYTTPEILRLERQMLVNVERIVSGPRSDVSRRVLEDTIKRVVSGGRKLDSEQALAVKHLVTGTNIRLLQGLAGTGKTTAVKTAVDVWRAERPDRQIIGCAVAGAAKDRLKEGVGEGIECRTLSSLLWRLDHDSIKLDQRSIVVLDEAGMVGTRQLSRLIEHVKDAPGSRLVLIGDHQQLQPVEAGGPFKYLASALGGACLSTIRRQKERWMRDAVKDMHDGRSDSAVRAYIENGCFHLAKNRDEAITKLLERWRADGGVENPKSVFLLASLNVEVKEINVKAQAERILAGKVDPDQKIHAGGVFFHVGDRLQFQKPSAVYNVQNSDCGTVLSVDEEKRRITVKLDKDDRTVQVDLTRYSGNNLRLGYASTTHKAQGASLPHVHVLVGGALTDKHMGYVQLSRGIRSTHLFCDAHTAGGPKMADLIRSLARERQKTLATELADARLPLRERQSEQLKQEQRRALDHHSLKF